MARSLPLVAVFAASLLSGGCGTCVNLLEQDHEKTFGGVKEDLDFIDKLVNADSPVIGGSGNSSPAIAVFLVAPFVDIPLSILGDMLTFPLTRWLDNRRCAPRPTPLVVPAETEGVEAEQNREK